MAKKEHITIIGAGMGGCLIAIYLARKNFTVTVYESRDNIELLPTVSNRSINQSLTIRGIEALKEVGLWEEIKKSTQEEKGRVIHHIDRTSHYQPYGKKQGFAEWSINRNELNKILLNELNKYKNINVVFQMRCVNINVKTKTVQVKNVKTRKLITKKTDFIIGADGIHSSVREILKEKKYTQAIVEKLDWGYKNMYIPATGKGTLAFRTHAFHCWPNGRSGIVGFPNSQGFFTCTLTLPLEGKESFASISSKSSLLPYFKENFPDLYPFIPNLVDKFLHDTPTQLASVKTSKWHYKDFVVLLGDAAHAVTIFYGQGINSAFEDCQVLSHCIDQYYPNLEKAFSSYQELRKPNTDVLATLCNDRFVELRDKYASSLFLSQSTVEASLEKLFPNFFMSLYTLVVHTRLPYKDAVKRYKRRKLLARLLGLDVIVFFYLFNFHMRKIIKSFTKTKRQRIVPLKIKYRILPVNK